MRHALATAGLVLGASLRAANAQGIIVDRIAPCGPAQDCAIRPCGIRACGPLIERTTSAVRIDLVNGVARYEVTETFINRGARVGEADYLYPMPKGAAFQDLKLSINGELVSGETMNATDARRIYEQIVAKQKDPALVEWMGYGLLRARIFPIAPGEEKKVVVRFAQVAEREGDAVRVDYFRGTVPQQGEQRTPITGSMRFTLSYPAESNYGRPYSPTHELQSRRDGDRQVVEVDGGARELTVLLPVRSPRDPAIAVLSQADGGNGRFAMITLTPPAITGDRAPRDVTFVLDISGSMSGRKMEQARAAGRQLLRTLSPNDRFRIVAFSSDVRTFRDGWSHGTSAELDSAREYIDHLDASGGTNIMGALAEALHGSTMAGRMSLVLFVTDGAPSVGERRPDVIADSARSWRGERRVFTFGLGSDLNVALLEQLALGGRGTAQFVRPEEDVERMVGITASRLMAPVVTDLRVRVDGVRLVHTLPNGPVDLFAGQDLVMLTEYQGTGRAQLRFEGRTARGPVTWTQDVNFPEHETNNAFVPRLWAAQRIGWLATEKRRTNTTELDGEIRTLGERYGIPTEFTSYLVVEPGMVVQRDRGGPVPMNAPQTQGSAGSLQGAGAAAAPMSAADARFESAKKASEQRSTITLADLPTERARRIKSTAGHSFTERDGVWADAQWNAATNKLPVLKVKSYSDAYFAVLRTLPRYKVALALGDHIIIVGKDLVLEIVPDGAATLTSAQLEQVRRSLE